VLRHSPRIGEPQPAFRDHAGRSRPSLWRPPINPVGVNGTCFTGLWVAPAGRCGLFLGCYRIPWSGFPPVGSHDSGVLVVMSRPRRRYPALAGERSPPSLLLQLCKRCNSWLRRLADFFQ
jgi:hypothetical protein